MEWCVASVSLLIGRRPVARQHPHLCERTFDAATWQVVVKKAKRKQVDFFLSFRTCFKITETKR
jgi:hypothetical protein